MNKTSTKFLLLLLIASSSFKMNAQTICMISADFQTGENYMVIWEELAAVDLPLIDSIFIFRQEGLETVYTKVGAVDVTPTSPTYFVDYDANTMLTTKYRISYLYNSGIESNQSLWHQGVVMDYDDASGMGVLTWTKYKKENQTDESYIYGYECRMDESGIGVFQSMSVMMNYDVQWTDQAFDLHPSAKYELLVSLPTCNVLTKSNINTSRSNIKNQQSNQSVMDEEAAAGIAKIQGTNFSISPNPATDFVTVTTSNVIKGRVWISDAKGQEVVGKVVEGNSVSFETDQFPSGFYFVSVDNDGVVTSKKFIKK